MASGRPDYWYGMMPGQSILDESQSAWAAVEEVVLDPGYAANLIDYVVPESYTLYLTGGIIACSYPGVQRFIVWVDDDPLLISYYDLNFVFPFDPKGGYTIREKQRVKVLVFNDDNVSDGFYVSLAGFEKYNVT